jgi:hypothetical protein
MKKDDIDKKILELNDKQRDISVEIEKLERLKSTIESASVLEALPLFDYDFCTNALQLYEKKGREKDGWKALDGAWNQGYHGQIFIEENIMLRRDDNDYRIRIQQADYREMKCDGYETDMKLLADFVKKYNLNVTYSRHERDIEKYSEMVKEKQEEIYFFKRCLSQ